MHGLLYAFQFLTRIPIPVSIQFTKETMGCSVHWFSLVGLVIGLLNIAVFLVCQWLSIPNSVAALLITISWVAVTGALHLDGLGDCADAWMSGKRGQEMLLVLKDLQVGTGALVAVPLVLLAKYLLITELLMSENIIWLIASPLIARSLMAVYLVFVVYFPNDGLGKSMADNSNRNKTLLSAAAAFTFIFSSSFYIAILSIFGASISMFILHVVITRRLGGANGDIYGALVETSETAVLFACVLLGSQLL